MERKTMEWFEKSYPDTKDRLHAFHTYIDNIRDGIEPDNKPLRDAIFEFVITWTCDYFKITRELFLQHVESFAKPLPKDYHSSE